MINLFVQEKGKLTGRHYEQGTYHSVDLDTALKYLYCSALSAREPQLFTKPMDDNGLYFPVLDLDDNRDEKSMKILSELDSYALIQSSGVEERFDECNHYWLIYGKSMELNGCLEWMERVNEKMGYISDYRYISCANLSRDIVLRAFPKSGYVPRIVNKTNISEGLSKWLDEFEAYWKNEIIDDIISAQFLRML